jgi:phage terminase small subunit
MSLRMIKGVSVGLSRNWFAALDGLNVVVGGSQIHQRDEHTMEIAYHMVENMGNLHVETGPVLPLG